MRKALVGTRNIQRDIEATLNPRVNPWPLDLINKPNLKTYGLAPVDGNNETNRAYTIATLINTITTGPIA